MPSVKTGQRLGPYRLIQEIGQGGMGAVFKAHDEELDRTVALKILQESISRDAQFEKRFQREAKLAGRLDHPNIVTIYTYGRVAGLSYLAMQFVQGADLDTILKWQGRLTIAPALKIVRQLCAGLDQAHERGIVHRDIKPRNIMLDAERRVKILDFGVAKLTDEDATRLTSAGHLLGTIPYMSPEQCGGLEMDHRSDIFSLGIVLYEMLAGHRPFQGATPVSVIRAIMDAEPAPLRGLLADAPPGLDPLIEGCLAKNPNDRHASCVALAEMCGRLLREMGEDPDRIAAEDIAMPSGTRESSMPDFETSLEDSISRQVNTRVETRVARHRPPPPTSAEPTRVTHDLLVRAIALRNGATEPLDEAAARETFIDAAEAGDSVAMLWVARLTLEGQCGFAPPADTRARQLAASCLRQVQWMAESGDMEAVHILGVCHELGFAVERNPRLAAWNYRAAAESGHVEAMYQLGEFLLREGFARDPKSAVHWLTQAARNRHALALRRLAQMSMAGEVLPKNEKEGRELFALAAERGDPESMIEFARILLRPASASSEKLAAIDWLRRAADAGHPAAMHALGVELDRGRVVSAEPEQAIEWFKKSAAANYAPAMEILMQRHIRW